MRSLRSHPLAKILEVSRVNRGSHGRDGTFEQQVAQLDPILIPSDVGSAPGQRHGTARRDWFMQEMEYPGPVACTG